MQRPKRRRKEIPCALCEEGTLDGAGVCHSCRKLWSKGAALAELEEKEEADKEFFAVGNWWYMNEFYALEEDMEKSYYTLRDELRSVLIDLAGIGKVNRRGMYHYSMSIVGDRPDGTESPPSSMYIGRKEVPRAMTRAIELIRAISNHMFLRGEEKGESFIMNMAEGRLSIDQIQDKFTKTVKDN